MLFNLEFFFIFIKNYVTDLSFYSLYYMKGHSVDTASKNNLNG